MVARQRRWLAGAALVALCACGPPPRRWHLEDFIRVGVDPRSEANEVRSALQSAGYRRVRSIEHPDFIALHMVDTLDHRGAIRIITRMGVVAAFDSTEADGVRPRHGPIELIEPPTEDHDIDGDGRPEVIIARRSNGGRCLALVRIGARGEAHLVRMEGAVFGEGFCASELDDVDNDGRYEALIVLSWPDLMAPAPQVRGALISRDGVYRADDNPPALIEPQRQRVTRTLEHARQALDFPAVQRCAIELAALAMLAGAEVSDQVIAFNEATSGLVLSETELASLRATRAAIAAGALRALPARDDGS